MAPGPSLVSTHRKDTGSRTWQVLTTARTRRPSWCYSDTESPPFCRNSPGFCALGTEHGKREDTGSISTSQVFIIDMITSQYKKASESSCSRTDTGRGCWSCPQGARGTRAHDIIHPVLQAREPMQRHGACASHRNRKMKAGFEPMMFLSRVCAFCSPKSKADGPREPSRSP